MRASTELVVYADKLTSASTPLEFNVMEPATDRLENMPIGNSETTIDPPRIFVEVNL